MVIDCAVCKKSTYRKPSYVKKTKQITCSYNCAAVLKSKNKVALNCSSCNKLYGVAPSVLKWSNLRGHKHRFCSRDCFVSFHIGKNVANWKGGRIVTDRGYILVQDKDTDRPIAGSYRYEHQKVVERAIGRQLREDEHIHHKDGNRSNNSINNLQIVSPSQHAQIHWKQRERNEFGQFA